MPYTEKKNISSLIITHKTKDCHLFFAKTFLYLGYLSYIRGYT